MADHRAATGEPDPPLDATSPDAVDSPDAASVDVHVQGAAAEPVLTRATYVQLVTAILPAVFALLAALGVKVSLDQSTALAVAIGAGGIVVAVINAAWVRVQAHRVRAVVTPVTDPRDAQGGQLISLAHARDLAAEAAADAAVSGQAKLLPVGTPTPTPWAEDTTLLEEAA